MNLHSRFIIIILVILGYLFSTKLFSQPNQDTTWYGREHFIIEGTLIPESLKNSPYSRLPLSLKEKVRIPVWMLSQSSAGISVRFLTNSTSLSVKWSLLYDTQMNHMAATGIKGVDLYFNNQGTWQYLNTARPDSTVNEFELMRDMTSEMREYRLYLPLYDGVTELLVGIGDEYELIKPEQNHIPSIVFYGTSITQGGCASRPGMVHTSIISRLLDVECINLGFSGNGMMEQPINELIAGYAPLFYVIECLPNMSPEQITERTIPLAETIRQKQPETPIVFVENFVYAQTVLNKSRDNLVNQRNEALRTQFQKLKADGFENVFLIEAENALGTDFEGTVDGVHFTDLGYNRYAYFLIEQFQKLNLIINRNRH